MKNRLCERGVTLVEVLMALVILLIVFMGLIQVSLLTIDNNAISVLRDEAVRLGSTAMTALRAGPFDDMNRDGTDESQAPGSTLNLTLSSTGTAAQQALARTLGINTQRTVRNVMNINYVVSALITVIDANNKQLDVSVQWTWKGQNYTHRVVSLVRR